MTRNLMKILDSLEFSSDTYIETVTLFYVNGKLMGLMPLGMKKLNSQFFARIFKSSRMYNTILNLEDLSRVKCKICISSNPITFYYAIFKKEKLVKAFMGKNYSRKFCDACIDATMTSYEKDQEFLKIYLKPIEIYIVRRYPKGFNRASAAIIEALVHYTKIPFVNMEEQKRLILKIEMCMETVYRSSEKPTYRAIIEEIFKRAKNLLLNS
ncbi:MAG: DUF447 family protein [Candidatus Methanomethylicia archaeon]